MSRQPLPEASAADIAALHTLYRDAADAEPAPQLDRAILAAAHAELEQSRAQAARRPLPWWRRWTGAASAIAIGVVGISLSWRVMDEQERNARAEFGAAQSSVGAAKPSAPMAKDAAGNMSGSAVSELPASTADKDRRAESSPPQRMQAVPESREQQAPAAAPPAVAPPPPLEQDAVATGRLKKLLPAPAAESAPAIVLEPAPAPAPAPVSPLAPIPRPAAVNAAPAPQAFPAAPALKANRAADTDELRERRDAPATKESAADLSVAKQKRQEAKTEVGGAAATVSDRATDDAATPEDWLKHIRELRAAGRNEEAAQSLARFRQRHPSFIVPEDVRR